MIFWFPKFRSSETPDAAAPHLPRSWCCFRRCSWYSRCGNLKPGWVELSCLQLNFQRQCTIQLSIQSLSGFSIYYISTYIHVLFARLANGERSLESSFFIQNSSRRWIHDHTALEISLSSQKSFQKSLPNLWRCENSSAQCPVQNTSQSQRQLHHPNLPSQPSSFWHLQVNWP